MSAAPLLVVDVQNGFVNDRSRHVVPAIHRLSSQWLSRGAPVFMSRFVNEEDSQWRRLLSWDRVAAAPETSLVRELDDVAVNSVIYDKTSYTSVVGPFLDGVLTGAWSEVYICGIATDGCVLASALDLFERAALRIRPVVIVDACASHAGTDVHDAGLALIGRFIGRGQLQRSTEISPV